MRIQNVNTNNSFKSALIVKGSENELMEISDTITNKAFMQNINFDPYDDYNNAQIIKQHDCDVLFFHKALKDDARYAIYTTFDEVKTIGKSMKDKEKLGILAQNGGFKAYYDKNADKDLLKIKIIDAKKIINAIKKNAFDAAKLKIKKAR